jgi:arsenate reductase (thioredoxin)
MAQTLFQRAAGGQHESRSAGSRPAERVHPEVVEALLEVGIDVSRNRPRKLERSDLEWADSVITMGCGDECPVVPGKRYADWDLEDPAARPLAEVREIRDEIGRRVTRLLQTLA